MPGKPIEVSSKVLMEKKEFPSPAVVKVLKDYADAAPEAAADVLAKYITAHTRHAKYRDGDTVDAQEVRHIAVAAHRAIKGTLVLLPPDKINTDFYLAAEAFLTALPHRYVQGEAEFKENASATLSLVKREQPEACEPLQTLHSLFHQEMQERGDWHVLRPRTAHHGSRGRS
jgi:hypothetical protein